MSRRLVSILSLTTPGRKRFRPWLVWNWAKQYGGVDVEVLLDDGPESIAEKRNALLARSKGDVVVWFDDDDWQSPKRAFAAQFLPPGMVACGPRTAYILRLGAKEAWCYSAPGLIFNGTAFRGEAARSVQFGPEDTSDTEWTAAVTALGDTYTVSPNFAWLYHGANTCLRPEALPLRGILRPTTLSEARKAYGDQWADTDVHLEALKERAP